MSVMTALVASSVADSGMMTPSPLNVVLTKILFASEASATEMAVASFLPRLTRICLAEASELFAFGRGVVDGGERHRVAAFDEVVRILEHRAGPLDGGDEFGRADAAVLVGVNQRGGLGAKFQAGGRAGQRDPEFLVELVEVHQVGTGFEFDLVKAAGAKEFPHMGAHSSF